MVNGQQGASVNDDDQGEQMECPRLCEQIPGRRGSIVHEDYVRRVDDGGSEHTDHDRQEVGEVRCVLTQLDHEQIVLAHQFVPPIENNATSFPKIVGVRFHRLTPFGVETVERV